MLTEYGINGKEMLSTLEKIHSGLTSVIAKNNVTRIMDVFKSVETINVMEMFFDNKTF